MTHIQNLADYHQQAFAMLEEIFHPSKRNVIPIRTDEQLILFDKVLTNITETYRQGRKDRLDDTKILNRIALVAISTIIEHEARDENG